MFCNGARRFTPAVEARITAAIAQLGYSANLVARSMVTGRTKAVGLVVLDVSNPHFTSIVKGANRVATAHDYSVVFVDTAENKAPERQLIEALSKRVDGLVVSSRMADESIEWLNNLGKPVVFFGRLGRFGLHSVGADGYQAALMLGRHLVELGHQRIAFVGFAGSRWNAERSRGLTDALAERGLSLTVHEAGGPTPEAGEAIASQVFLGAVRPDAVVAYNDLLALGLMHQAHTLGVAIPQSVSVAGFDDIIYGRYMTPPLTTVALHSEEIGELAMQRLLQLVAGDHFEPFDEIIAPRLIPRGSTQRRDPINPLTTNPTP